MAYSRAHSKQRQKWTGIAIIGGLVAYAAVQSYLHNGVVSSAPIPAGYTYRAPKSHYEEVTWPTLKQGQWPRGGKPLAPEAVKTLDGQPTLIKGFLLPLHNASASSEFFISTKPGGCPFCNPVGVADVVLLHTHGNRKMEVINLPVMAYGTLHVASGAPTDQ